MGISNKNYHFGFIRSGHEASEWMKCRKDPIYFMKTYLKITTLKYGQVPFSLFLFQEMLIQTFTRKRNSIILKPRQMGITTIVCAYVLWLCIFHSHKNVILISIKFSTAKGMLKKIKEMYRTMPDFLKEPTTNGSTQTDVGTASCIEFVNKSTITAVASSEEAARSEALSLLVMDEAAFIKQADGIWAAARPTLSTGGSSIILSTAFGMGNFFHSAWMSACTKENLLYPVQLNWRMRPDYDDKWYQETKMDLGFKRTMQEIDCDFLQSGMNVFDMNKIRAIEDRMNGQSPIHTEQAGFEGIVYQYHPYDPTRVYTIGADIATGRAKDNSAFSIYDDRGLEVACYKGKILPRQFAHLLIKWGHKYGQAMISPEINGIGEGVLAILQEMGYQNVYNDVAKVLKMDEWQHRESDVMGWLTTGKSRHQMITGFDYDIENELITPNNPYFVKEAMTFIYDGMNRPVAMGKGSNVSKSSEFYDEGKTSYSDDAIMGECIANETRKKPNRFSTGNSTGVFGGWGAN